MPPSTLMLKESKYRYSGSSRRRANQPITLVFKPAIIVCTHESVTHACFSPAESLVAGGKWRCWKFPDKEIFILSV